jgi:hypothetical protein
MVFGLTRTLPEPTIDRTRGEHVNHYTTDAVRVRFVYTCTHVYNLFLTSYLSLVVSNRCLLAYQYVPQG